MLTSWVDTMPCSKKEKGKKEYEERAREKREAKNKASGTRNRKNWQVGKK